MTLKNLEFTEARISDRSHFSLFDAFDRGLIIIKAG